MAYTHQAGGKDWCVSYLETSDWYEYIDSTSVTWHGFYSSVSCKGDETETTLNVGDCVAYGDTDYYISLEAINANYVQRTSSIGYAQKPIYFFTFILVLLIVCF